MTARLVIATDSINSSHKIIKEYICVNHNISLCALHRFIKQAEYLQLECINGSKVKIGENGEGVDKMLLNIIEHLKTKKSCRLVIVKDIQVRQIHLEQSQQYDRILLIQTRNNWLAHRVVRGLREEMGITYDIEDVIDALEDYIMIYLDSK